MVCMTVLTNTDKNGINDKTRIHTTIAIHFYCFLFFLKTTSMTKKKPKIVSDINRMSLFLSLINEIICTEINVAASAQ